MRRDGGVWEKYGFGIPIAQQKEIRAGTLDDQIETNLKNYAAHLNSYLVGQYGYEIDIRFPAHAAPDPTSRIETHNKEMVTAFLAGWMLHGALETGTRNVTSEHMAFFRSILQHKAEYFCRVLDTKGRPGSGLLPTLIDLNYVTPPGFRYPKVRITGIKERDIGQFVNNLKTLVDAGAVTIDDRIEAHARREAGLPDKG